MFIVFLQIDDTRFRYLEVMNKHDNSLPLTIRK